MSTATATPKTTSGEVARSASPRFFQGWSLAALIFIGPAVLLLAVFMVYPAIQTIVLSFDGALGNYVRLLTDDPRFLHLTVPPRGGTGRASATVPGLTSGKSGKRQRMVA